MTDKQTYYERRDAFAHCLSQIYGSVSVAGQSWDIDLVLERVDPIRFMLMFQEFEAAQEAENIRDE